MAYAGLRRRPSQLVGRRRALPCPSPSSQIGASLEAVSEEIPKPLTGTLARAVDLAFSMNAAGSKYLQSWDIDPRTRNDVGDLSLCRKRHPPNL